MMIVQGSRTGQPVGRAAVAVDRALCAADPAGCRDTPRFSDNVL